MEHVHTALVRIAAARIGDASAPQGLITALEAHRNELRRRRGFLRMQVTRSSEEGGDTLLAVETRWRDAAALNGYLAGEPNAVSIIRAHEDETVAGSLETRQMEALESEHAAATQNVHYERFALALLVPAGILAFGLAVIYSLSRIYLEIGHTPSTLLAAVIAIGILLAAWYFASNPAAMRVQLPAVGLTVAAVLIGGTIVAAVREDPQDGMVGAPTPADGTPAAPAGLVLLMDDNFFEFNGERNPTIEVGANVDVTIQVENIGAALHNVHVALNGYDAAFCTVGGEAPCSDPARIAGGESGTLTFNLPPGTYDYRCDFHVQDMVGQFEVVEGGPTGGEEPPPPAPDGEQPAEGNIIIMGDNFFEFGGMQDPTITIPANEEVTFTLPNEGAALHNMHVAIGGQYEAAFCTAGGDAPCSDPARISGGGEGTITLNLPPGTYDFRCDFHTADMVGVLRVE